MSSSPNPNDYLGHCEDIDADHPDIIERAQKLAGASIEETAKNCFEFVRDSIQHTGDEERNPVTCRASDVLWHGIGYCYAKSHLLCAFLRANQIPAGLCYQRLSIEGDGAPFCLHGLNAVHLPDHGWYRIDARGNKPGVDAQFIPPREQLAFATDMAGERDLDEIWQTPHPAVIECLRRHEDWLELSQDLPDQDLPDIEER
ncbi:Phosphonate ABC transporter phosphate-binding periplasmic component [Rhodopirellula islandica]|uniref:Phosphonate ABC transporter phosphate-binding periplasmic component n=1 Tax=Rhodopirellula islandica TaxID=595434 RepID=A0A0J1E839_RHOIS|nr:transglutaminase family protein [Rhodopirellula islandica]KLU01624.1 Phosphonate ABC transporter phosphate-binding periplasmic component [Rhodopirellula islandica]